MPKTSSSAADLRILDSIWRETVTRTVLPNGVTLILKADHSAALASVQVWVRTGSIHEGANLGAGLSHYLEHMLFKGTGRRAGREISATVQAHGGAINAYTTFDRTVYYIDLPSEHTAVAIDVLADAVLKSTLPADEAIKEKDVILREIAMTQDDPEDRLWQRLFANTFREHPYGHPIIGHREVFSAVTPEDLGRYYRSRYLPNNLVVVVVGDIDPAAVTASVTEHFGGTPRASLAPVLVPAEPAQLAPREQHGFEEVEVSRTAVAWPVPGLAHPDAPVLDLLAITLGQGESSALWQELRDRAGLVHTIDATCWNPGTSGLFCVSFTSDGDKRAAATDALERVLARLGSTGFGERQLRKALRQTVASEIHARQTMSGQASRLGAAEVVVGDLDYSRNYFARLGSVTPADLKRVLKTYLAPAVRTAVSINPAPKAGAGANAPRKQSGTKTAARPEAEEIRLPNGARLLLQPDRRLPNLHFALLAQGGGAYESAGKRGATALLATLLAKDTTRRSAAEVAQYIEEVGGSFYPFSGNTCLGVAAEVLSLDADRAIDVIAEGITRPAFRAGTFKVEREAQLAGLLQDADEVVVAARKKIRRQFFGSHPLALDAHGEESGVKALAPQDLAALHQRLFVAPNIVLSVAGDFDPRRLGPKLKAFLAKLPRGAEPKLSRGASLQEHSLPPVTGDFVEHQRREQAVVLQSFPGPAMHTPDYYVGEVADECFSGMASRLFERVREEKGLAYFVRSARVSGLDGAMFCFLAGTQPGRENEVLAEINAEVERMQAGGIEKAELERCQARLKAARRQSLQTLSAKAFQAGLNVLQGQPANDWKNYDARVAAVTIGDLARFAGKYFLKTRRVQLVVRP